MGDVEIPKLTLSLKSRINVEMSYALVTLTLLSTSIVVQEFKLDYCDDLLEEMIYLLASDSGTENLEIDDNEIDDVLNRQVKLHRQVIDLSGKVRYIIIIIIEILLIFYNSYNLLILIYKVHSLVLHHQIE